MGRPITQHESEETQKEILNLNPYYCPIPSILPEKERAELIKSVYSGEAPDLVGDIDALVKENKFIYCYDGFEPSGRMHIAQGLMKSDNVNKLIDAGCIFNFWVADWFAMLNEKMWGDLDKIKVVGRYFVEVWKATGMKMSNVRFLWASDHIT